MVKKLFILFLCFIFAAGLPVYANGESVETEADITRQNIAAPGQKLYVLSLKEAIELAKKNNPELNVCDIKMQSTEVSLDAARLDRGKSRNAVVRMSMLNTAYVKEGYHVEVNEAALRLGKLEKKKIENKIAYNVTQKYYNYKLAERLIDIAEKSYQLALENKKAVDKSYELGMVSKLEVRNAEVMVTQSLLAKENYVRNLDILKEDLKIALQLDGMDCSFILTDDIEFKEYNTDLESDIEEAMKKRYDANSLKEAEALSKLYFDITKKYAHSNTAIYHTAHSDYIQSKYNYENTSKQIALSIRSSYNAIIAAKGDISIAEQNLSIRQTEYEAAKLKFEMGMITNIELTEKLNRLSEYEVQLENAKLAYKLAVEKYQYEIAIGL